MSSKQYERYCSVRHFLLNVKGKCLIVQLLEPQLCASNQNRQVLFQHFPILLFAILHLLHELITPDQLAKWFLLTHLFIFHSKDILTKSLNSKLSVQKMFTVMPIDNLMISASILMIAFDPDYCVSVYPLSQKTTVSRSSIANLLLGTIIMVRVQRLEAILYFQ